MFYRVIEKLKISIFEFLKFDYKYLVSLILISIVCFYPVNYYIIVGGGISSMERRVEVENGYSSLGSFNLSYVRESDGVLLTYLLSYIVPTFERSSVEDYKYDSNDKVEDILFRNKLSLDTANSHAMKVAYSMANKEVELVENKTYVVSVNHDLDCPLQAKDEILEMDGQKLDTSLYRRYIQSLEEGSRIKVKILRDGKEKEVECRVYKMENISVMGVYLMDLPIYDGNPSIDVHFKSSESGPSAGLMTALEMYNQLVKEDITKGLKIAGTGTIDGEGNVGEIGGVEHKLIGAVHGGADVFLVPMGENYDTVVKVAKEKKFKIKIIGVSTFSDALEKLAILK